MKATKKVLGMFALAAAFVLVTAGCNKSEAKPANNAASQEQIAAEVARQVAEQLAATQTTAEATAQAVAQSAAAPAEAAPAWKPGVPGPNGGLVYYAEDGEYYEATAPGNTVGINDNLPAGWIIPDIDDLGIIYAGIQKAGAADYGNVYYTSVSKTGGKTRFLRMSAGAEATDVSGGRKLGVRSFDPSQSPTQIAPSALAYTPAASTAQAGSSPAPATATTKVYAIGDTGPRGGIVFAASGGKGKEITKPENAGSVSTAPPAGWKLASMPELMQVYTTLRSKADFGDIWYRSSSTRHRLPNGWDGTDYTRDHAMLSPAQSDYDRIRALFPDVQFILTFGGGFPTEYFIRFTDGKIVGGGTEDGDYWYAFDDSGAVLNDAKCLFVRDF
jgi:hypothetical protein